MLMEQICNSNRSLHQLTKGFVRYPQVLKNVVVTDKEETLASEAVKAAVTRATEQLGDNGRVLLRASGTEPVLRVMAEANTFAICEQHVDAIIEAMRQAGYLIRVK